MTRILVSIDYGDDNPKEWKVMETSLPSELEEIYNYAVKHKYAPSSSKALKFFYIKMQKTISFINYLC